MGGQDPSHRFDYLFEPLDGETTTRTTAIPAVRSVAAGEVAGHRRPRTRRWWPLPVMAVVVGVIGAVVLVSWRPAPADVAPIPVSTAPHPTATPVVTSVPVVEAPPEPAPVPEPAPPPAATTVVQAPVTMPPATAPTPTPAPDSRQAPTPTLRPPISVSPEPRQPFPNQHPPASDQDRGGLLGGLL